MAPAKPDSHITTTGGGGGNQEHASLATVPMYIKLARLFTVMICGGSNKRKSTELGRPGRNTRLSISNGGRTYVQYTGFKAANTVGGGENEQAKGYRSDSEAAQVEICTRVSMWRDDGTMCAT
ncbi:hypothetical protein FRC12_019569 [Ceratobasidium sp. 428]|nr:hypothetical protein FRC12_019569 [Ceratobasidium sp. 428]